MHRFNHKWFDEFPDWLEYSISKDAAFCLYWHNKASLQTHVGGHARIYNQSKRKCEDLTWQQQSIHTSFEKQFNQDKHGYLSA